MLIAKHKITSYFKGRKVYACQGDKLTLLWQSGDVGCYLNEETKEKFPTKIINVKEIDDGIILEKERDIEDKIRSQRKSKVKYNPSQTNLF